LALFDRIVSGLIQGSAAIEAGAAILTRSAIEMGRVSRPETSIEYFSTSAKI
jgi:hypothetical protein